MVYFKYFFGFVGILILGSIPVLLLSIVWDSNNCKNELFNGDVVNIENPNVHWTIGRIITTKNDGKQWCRSYWILINVNGEKRVLSHCSNELFSGEANVNNNAFYKVYYNCKYPDCNAIDPEFRELSSREIDSYIVQKNQKLSDYYINPTIYKEINETSAFGDQFSDSIKPSNQVEGPLFTFWYKTFGWYYARDNCGCVK